MKRLLLHPWLTVRAQVALGAVFLLASLGKLADPPGFAKAIWNYQLFPAFAIHPLALTLPWLECLCGLALCLGLWVRAAASWIALLLLAFLAALGFNLARHRPVDCGCFQNQGQVRTEHEHLVDMRWAMGRDLALLALAAQVLIAAGRRNQA